MSTFEQNGFPARQGLAQQLYIDTPEQVELQFAVAGLGSRFVAVLIDSLLQFAFLVLETLLAALISNMSPAFDHKLNSAGKWTAAIIILINFVILTEYFAAFEAYWNGQTPGKRLMKLRVIKDSGRQITFFEALARNLIRYVDFLPSLYLAGVITMLCNKQNKRLGDLAAGTIVVHEVRDEAPLLPRHNSFLPTPQVEWKNPVVKVPFPADAIARLQTSDLAIIDTFFARVLDLNPDVRSAMALRIAQQMTAKMGVDLPEGNPENALEAIAIGMRGGGRTGF